MKKIKDPNLKVIKFESMDVIATSTFSLKADAKGETITLGDKITLY